MAYKTVNRGWLLRMCQQGKLWVKCKYHMTDDYAYDAAVGFGKMDEYRKAYVRPEPVWPEGSDDWSYIQRQEWFGKYAAAADAGHQGEKQLYASDFKGHGSAYCEGDKNKGTLSIHSNLSYAYEVR